MLTKIIDNEYKRTIAKGIIISMLDEITGVLDLVAKDIDNENIKLLHVHKLLFIATVEEELCITDKITMYAYAEKRCTSLLMDRIHTKKLRQAVHKWARHLDKRIKELKEELRSSPEMLIEAHKNAMASVKELIRIAYINCSGDYSKIDKLYLLLVDIRDL